MCGIAGFTGVSDPVTRAALTLALGWGIDERGGHAIGYVSVHPGGPNGGNIRYGRKLGEWRHAKRRFLASASGGEVATLLHARFATLPNKGEVNCAHPFAIKRDNETRLWGVHNGVSPDAYFSAKMHKRPFDVDSREVFELLADEQRSEISSLDGWGVLGWVRGDERQRIRLCMVSECGELHVTRTTSGAIVFGSTRRIVDDALDVARLERAAHYALTAGTTYYAEGGAFYETKEPRLMFREASRWGSWKGWGDARGLLGSASTGTGDGGYRYTDFEVGKDGVYSEDRYRLDEWESSPDIEVADDIEDSTADIQVEDDDWDDDDWWRHLNDNEFDRAAFLNALEADDRRERRRLHQQWRATRKAQ